VNSPGGFGVCATTARLVSARNPDNVAAKLVRNSNLVLLIVCAPDLDVPVFRGSTVLFCLVRDTATVGRMLQEVICDRVEKTGEIVRKTHRFRYIVKLAWVISGEGSGSGSYDPACC
jgi:hypothetical protein